MDKQKSRLRMIAGPNGSGKSTLIQKLNEQNINLGIYLNADDLEKEIKEKKILHFQDYSLKIIQKDFDRFLFNQNSILSKLPNKNDFKTLKVYKNILVLGKIPINSYLSSFIIEFIRYQLLKSSQSFTFETVMSHQSKVLFLKEAKELGYKTYLYYVATPAPSINIERIKIRVEKGGHHVAEEKIHARYYKSLELLIAAIKSVDKAYIFDNSSDEIQWIAEIQEGKNLELKTSQVPSWFNKYVLDKL